MKKNVIIAVIISVLVVIILGVSFAYFTPQILEGNIFSTTGTAKDNSANITLTGESGINLTNAYPMTDEEGLATDPYTFTIKNNETASKVKYQIVLETKSGNTLSDHLITTNFGELTTNSSITPTTEGYTNAYVINTDFLNENESKTIDLHVWIDKIGDLSNSQNKTWAGKIVVKGTKEANIQSLETVKALNLSIKSGTPDFGTSSPTRTYHPTGFNPTISSASTTSYQSRYYSYADSYVFNKTTNRYELVNPKIGVYSSIYSSLAGKYVINYSGSTSSTVITSSTIIYKIQSATSSTITYQAATRAFGFNDSINNGIFSAQDDYGTSYYFRGSPENNYVKFGKWASNTPSIYVGYYNSSVNYNFRLYSSLSECQNAASYKTNCTEISRAGKDMYWRIIRINGDGSVRIQYDGTETHENGVFSVDRIIGTSAFNEQEGDNAYVGYMYGAIAATSYNDTHANTNSSAVKTFLDNWYKNNLSGTTYESSISDEIFCNDRSLASNQEAFDAGFTSLGYGNNASAYGTFERLIDPINWDALKPSKPILTCPQKNDAFTKTDTIKGNGKLTYPVGLITADEINMAGSILSGGNSKIYLNKGMYYWSMSPEYSADSYTLIFISNTSGYLSDSDTKNDYFGVVPVINLSPSAAQSLIGTGTMTDPYRLN